MERPRRLTTEEAQKAVEDFVSYGDDNGIWEARCACGAICGQRLTIAGPPTKDSKRYVACPECDGLSGGIEWVLLTPTEPNG